MKTKILFLVLICSFQASLPTALAQGTAFLYQCKLMDGGSPANGRYDLVFTLYDALTDGTRLGAVITNQSVAVSEGILTISLDFGSAVFSDSPRWLDIAVRTNGNGAYTSLRPRQSLAPTPFAIFATAAGSATLATNAQTMPWTGLLGVPAGFTDGTDNDTRYSAGDGLKLASTSFSVDFAGTGSATAVARSDHHHDTNYMKLTPVLQVSTNGLVGIGTNQPTAGLDIRTGGPMLAPKVLFEVQDGTEPYTNLYNASSVSVAGNLLGVGAENNPGGVSLVDISDPTAPILRFQISKDIPAYTNLVSVGSVVLTSNLLIIPASFRGTVTFVSVTNPAAPVKIAELRDEVAGWNHLKGAKSAAVSGNLLAIAAGDDQAITLADISNPASPVQRAVIPMIQYGLTYAPWCRPLALSGNLLAVAASNSITLFDVSNPASPVQRSQIVQGTGAFTSLAVPFTVALSGNWLAVAVREDAVTIVDVSNPFAPVHKATLRQGGEGFDLLRFPMGVAISGNRLAVTADLGVTLLELSPSAPPRKLAEVRRGVGGAHMLLLSTDAAFFGDNLAVASVSDDAFTLLGFEPESAGLFSDGWVGIGTRNPVAPLHVIGDVTVEQADRFNVMASRVEIGASSQARGQGSIALGVEAESIGNQSVAIGTDALAEGFFALALGRHSWAVGSESTALGGGYAPGYQALALGYMTRAQGDGAVALGNRTAAYGDFSTTLGEGSDASGAYSVAGGNSARAEGAGAIALGWAPRATGSNAVALGKNTLAEGEASFAVGGWSHATGDFSTALGRMNLASNHNAVALGTNTIAGGVASLAAGTRAQATHDGTFVWADSQDAAFASTASNQFLIHAKGGVGIGTNNPQSALHVGGTVTANAFAGSGAALTGLNGAALANNSVTTAKITDGTITPNDVAPNAFWNTTGNNGTTPNTHFLGTADNQPLELKVNNQRALRLEPNSSGAPNVIGGSPYNVVESGILGATIAGGGSTITTGNGDTNRIGAHFASIGGGSLNQIWGRSGTIAGGYNNAIITNAYAATIGGGAGNHIYERSQFATISGGAQNTIGTNALNATISGGDGNTIMDNSKYSTIPGGSLNLVSGIYSFAAGRRAFAVHGGTFVWADSQDANFSSTGANQFLIRAQGGVGIGTAPEDALLDVEGNVRLNDYDLFLRGGNDRNHGLGWYGVSKLFAGLNVDGPVIYGWTGGLLGTKNGGEKPSLAWSHDGRVNIDPGNLNTGSVYQASLVFGASNSGEAIASKRSAGGNQHGLDLYTSYQPRLSIANNGNIGIGKTEPSAKLDVDGGIRATGALRLGSETGTAGTPRYPADSQGLVVRRVCSTDSTAGSVVARTDVLLLERDGTAAGLRIAFYTSPGRQTINCTGITASGAPVVFKHTFNNPTVGSYRHTIFPGDQRVVHYDISFGNPYNAGHTCHLVLDRYDDGVTSDPYLVGTLTSSYNQ